MPGPATVQPPDGPATRIASRMFRCRFAERYPTETEMANALTIYNVLAPAHVGLTLVERLAEGQPFGPEKR